MLPLNRKYSYYRISATFGMKDIRRKLTTYFVRSLFLRGAYGVGRPKG
jgi:hypothetical protein